MPRKSPPPELPPLALIRPLSPVSPLGTTYRMSPVSPLTPSPPPFCTVDFGSTEPAPVPGGPQHTQPEPCGTTPVPVLAQPKNEHLAVPLVRPERPQAQSSHSSVNVLPQRPEWSDSALEAKIARFSNESKARRDFYILLAIVFVLGIIFLIVWLSVSNAGH